MEALSAVAFFGSIIFLFLSNSFSHKSDKTIFGVIGTFFFLAGIFLFALSFHKTINQGLDSSSIATMNEYKADNEFNSDFADIVFLSSELSQDAPEISYSIPYEDSLTNSYSKVVLMFNNKSTEPLPISNGEFSFDINSHRITSFIPYEYSDGIIGNRVEEIAPGYTTLVFIGIIPNEYLNFYDRFTVAFNSGFNEINLNTSDYYEHEVMFTV